MKKVLFVLLATCISTPAYATGHRIYLENVQNFARDIEPSSDFKALKAWNETLRREPVIAGHGKPTYALMKAINDKVNTKPYQLTPEWPTLGEFNGSKSGDCKGFSIAKYYMLRRVGFSASQLNLWSGDYDGHSHMVLVASLEGKQYVLDIGAGANLPLAKEYFYKHFQPAYRFNENGWDVQ